MSAAHEMLARRGFGPTKAMIESPGRHNSEPYPQRHDRHAHQHSENHRLIQTTVKLHAPGKWARWAT